MSSIKESNRYNGEIDFKYFIFLALKKEISWDNLAIILDGLATTLQRSKELNKILLEELKQSEESLFTQILRDETSCAEYQSIASKDTK